MVAAIGNSGAAMASNQSNLEEPIDRVVSYEEACVRLGRSIRSLYREIHAGRLKAIQLSARRRGIRSSEIQRYLESLESA
jgi:excisionase family DNA binding protein